MNFSKKNYAATRPFSAQNHVKEAGRNGSRPGTAVSQKKIVRPASAVINRNRPENDEEFENMMEEAKKIHYDFDPLINFTKFSDFSGFKK